MSPTTVLDRPLPAARKRVSSFVQLHTLTKAMLRGFFRDRAAMFFTFFFPLMFIIVFGLIFRGGTPSITIGVVGDGPVIKALPATGLKLHPFADADKALRKVSKGDLPAVLIERGTTLTLRFAASDPTRSATVNAQVRSVVDGANVRASGRPPVYSLESTPVEDSSLRTIQYITPGILSWGVATSAAFGAAMTLVAWRRKQILRRIRLSPAPVWTVVGARVGVSMTIALVQGAVFIGVAMTPPFGLKLTGDWWLAVPLLLVGTLSFLSIGLLVGAVAKTEEAASAIANFLVLPMAFLSGTFFDISSAPSWLQGVSKVLPLRWLNDAMLDVLARGQGPSAIWAPVLVLLAFAAVVGLIATRVFRWDDA